MRLQFDTEAEIPPEAVQALARVAAAAEQNFALPAAVVDLVFAEAGEMQKLNAETRGVDSVTDVLSYPSLEFATPGTLPALQEYDMDPESGELMLGSIALCPDRIREQAQEYGHSQLRELSYLFAHGLCHLMGYDHMVEADRRAMREQEEQILALAQISRED